MDLSVVIVSFNVRDYLRQCLISVYKASEDIDCEVFVVDNNSSDRSAEMVSEEFPKVRLIVNNFNSGFSAANNQAIKIAEGKFILLLNPDTVISVNTFSKCIRFMNEHPDAGAVGVRMVNGEGIYLPESKRGLPTPATAFFKITGLSSIFPGSPFFNRYYLANIDSCETAPGEVISGAFMFLKKEALMATGLPDEDFFMYGEDIDLSYRILQAGFNNYYFPEVEIVHFKGKSTPRDNYTDIVYFYQAMRIYSRKRQNEKFSILYFFILPTTYFVEGLSLCKRFIRRLNR